MELRTIQTFLYAYELNSFTRAADRSGYTQSTVTIQIQQLEEELGTRLFDRIGKKVMPTQQGIKFYEYANELIQLERKAKEMLSKERKASGPLRLGVTESLLNEYILRIIPEFRRQYPEVFLDIQVECSEELIQKLKQNQYDLVMVTGNVVRDKECENLIWWQEKGIFVASVTNPLSREPQISLEKVLSQPMIVSDAEGMFCESLNQLAENCNMSLNTVLRVNNSRVIMELVEKDIGISFMPEYIAKEKIEEGTVVKLPVEDCQVIYYTQVLQHKKKWQCLSMASMLEIIKQDLKTLAVDF